MNTKSHITNSSPKGILISRRQSFSFSPLFYWIMDMVGLCVHLPDGYVIIVFLVDIFYALPNGTNIHKLSVRNSFYFEILLLEVFNLSIR